MNKATEKKLKEVLDRLGKGESHHDIIKDKFSRSQKRYVEFYERIKSDLTEEERELLNLKEESPQCKQMENKSDSKSLALSSTSPLPLKELLTSPQHMKTLESLIMRGGELLTLLDTKEEAQDLHILEVPSDFIELKDLKVSSKRVSESVEKAFNELAAKNKQYSKTSLLNLAIWEFVEKYK